MKRTTPTPLEVNVRELREQLSELLDAVESGKQVLITRRGQAVARLTRPPAGFSKERLAELARLRESIEVQGEPLSETVINERRDARS